MSSEEDTGLADNPHSLAANEHPLVAALQNVSYPIDGVRCIRYFAGDTLYPADIDSRIGPDAENQLRFFFVGFTFDNEEMSLCSHALQKAEDEPRFYMHFDEAARLGIAAGVGVLIALER